jgi:hypothetical protein
MDKLGYIWSPLAAIAWFITIIVMGAIYLFPQVRTLHMPLPMEFYDNTVLQFFMDFGVIGSIALVALNFLANKFGLEEMRKPDLFMTRLACAAMIVIAFVVFVVGWGRDGLPTEAINLLLGITIFSVIDYGDNTGEESRRRKVAAEAAHGAVPAGHGAAHAAGDTVYEIDISDGSAARIGARVAKWLQENPTT